MSVGDDGGLQHDPNDDALMMQKILEMMGTMLDKVQESIKLVQRIRPNFDERKTIWQAVQRAKDRLQAELDETE